MPIDWFPLWPSLRVAAISTVMAIVLGLWVAWVLANRAFRGKELIDAAVTLPLVPPPTVLGKHTQSPASVIREVSAWLRLQAVVIDPAPSALQIHAACGDFRDQLGNLRTAALDKESWPDVLLALTIQSLDPSEETLPEARPLTQPSLLHQRRPKACSALNARSAADKVRFDSFDLQLRDKVDRPQPLGRLPPPHQARYR